MSRRDDWNERYASRELVWSAGPNKLFAEQVADLLPGSALDLACGEGRNALWLAENDWQTTAVDFSEVAIDKARQIGVRRGVSVNWIVADVATDPLPDRSYDLVCLLYLHTGPEERARWLKRAISYVAPGGTFLYVGHDPRNIQEGVGGPQRPELLPDVQELVAALEDFRIDAAEVVSRPVANDPGHGQALSGTALDTLVKATRVKPAPAD